MNTATRLTLRAISEREVDAQGQAVTPSSPLPPSAATSPPPAPQVAPTTNDRDDDDLTLQVVGLALRLISERLVAISSGFFPLVALGTGFVLWLKIMASPSVSQLVGLGLYSLFMLALTWIKGSPKRK